MNSDLLLYDALKELKCVCDMIRRLRKTSIVHTQARQDILREMQEWQERMEQ